MLGSQISYSPGDALLVHPINPPDIVESFLGVLRDGISSTSRLAISPRSDLPRLAFQTSLHPWIQAQGWHGTAGELCTGLLDLTAPVTRHGMEILADLATSKTETERLREFATAEWADEFHKYCTKERRTIVEVLFLILHMLLLA